MRAAIYCRISKDAEQAGLGVARQEKDCTALCASRGWEVAAVLVDNDVSAYSGRKREGYTRLLGLLRDGEVDAVVAWHPDRLHRSPKELEQFIDVIEQAGATVSTVTAGELDLASPSGRMTARVVGAVARHESEQKSQRLRRKMEEIAEQGGWKGGGTRPFGYEPDRVTLRPSEAKLVRDAVAHVIGGGTVRSVVTSWTTAGVPTVTGAPWSHKTVRRLLGSPRIAGLRTHRGVIIGPARWQAIITAQDHERVKAALEALATVPSPGRRYLLTGGIARCGLCGGQLYARPRDDRARSYVCLTPQGCGKIRALAEPLEVYVRDLLFDWARDVRFDPPDDDRSDLLATLADLEARKARLAEDHYVTGVLDDPGQFRAASKALDDRLRKARRALAEADRGSARARLRVDDLAARWGRMDPDQRRQVVAALVDEVVVAPAVRGRNFFDPDRVTVTFR